MLAIVPTDDRADQDLLLDLLNSTPTADGVRADELGDRGTARAWLEAHGGGGSAKEIARVREIRTVLQSLVRGEETPAALAPYLKGIGYRPTVTDEGLSWSLDASADERLATRAVLAWDGLRSQAPGRLRPCANDECTLFLIDRSKANNARWCSMAVCGNRMKARRHYQRQRGTQR
jgi:predicted RNA-binding Zn ribbon-like protein